ncbi:MAG: hypothetical protein JNL26_20370, partial [Gemmatimonadetes bacterium]|nr:hypothetical protein [Gemmatimonadota bacterium]
VELEVMRYGDRKSFRVKLIEAPAEERQVAETSRNRDAEREDEPVRGGTYEAKPLGATVEAITDEYARENRLSADRRGVRVVEAERWALRAGYFSPDGSDLITAVLFPRPRKEIRSTADLREVLTRVKDGDTISLQVYNVQAQQSRVVSLTIGEQ